MKKTEFLVVAAVGLLIIGCRKDQPGQVQQAASEAASQSSSTLAAQQNAPKTFDETLSSVQQGVSQYGGDIHEIRQLDRFLTGGEAVIGAAEIERRYEAVAESILTTGDFQWFDWFRRFETDGALSELMTDFVWHYVSRHTKIFFDNAAADDKYQMKIDSIGLGFGTVEEEKQCLNSIADYIRKCSDNSRRAFAGKWLKAVKEDVADYEKANPTGA